MRAKARDLVALYPNATHRRTGPSDKYNCHGLTFASRRTGVSPEEIGDILLHDGYAPVPLAEILPGDIAIYRSATEIIHSGIVVGKRGDIPWVLSKWGQMDEVVHAVTDCEYRQAVVTYHRVKG